MRRTKMFYCFGNLYSQHQLKLYIRCDVYIFGQENLFYTIFISSYQTNLSFCLVLVPVGRPVIAITLAPVNGYFAFFCILLKNYAKSTA